MFTCINLPTSFYLVTKNIFFSFMCAIISNFQINKVSLIILKASLDSLVSSSIVRSETCCINDLFCPIFFIICLLRRQPF